MKRPRFLTFLLVLLMLAPILQSCLDSDDNGYTTIATIKVIDGKDYYFGLENGDKMYPSDTTEIHSYKVIDGQRAFVWFDKLDEAKTGYNYNIKVRGISDILTKGIIPLTTETADSIGNDRISIYWNDYWIAQNYFTIHFYFMGTSNPEKLHMVNLVQNETLAHDEDGYIHLEFRHNAYDDPQDQVLHGYVSFKLDKIAEEMKTAKGIKLRVRTIEDGEQTYTLNFNEANSKGDSYQGSAHSTGTIF